LKTTKTQNTLKTCKKRQNRKNTKKQKKTQKKTLKTIFDKIVSRSKTYMCRDGWSSYACRGQLQWRNRIPVYILGTCGGEVVFLLVSGAYAVSRV
jgi:hypothetical protein